MKVKSIVSTSSLVLKFVHCQFLVTSVQSIAVIDATSEIVNGCELPFKWLFEVFLQKFLIAIRPLSYGFFADGPLLSSSFVSATPETPADGLMVMRRCFTISLDGREIGSC